MIHLATDTQIHRTGPLTREERIPFNEGNTMNFSRWFLSTILPVAAVVVLVAVFCPSCATVEGYADQAADAKVRASITGLHLARKELCNVASVGAVRVVFPTEAEQQAWQALCGPMVLLNCETQP